MNKEIERNIPLRKQLFNILDGYGEDIDRQHIGHKIYSVVMTGIIILSLIPLGFRENTPELEFIEFTCVGIFIVDYLLRWMTADYRFGNGVKSIVIYPFRPMAIVDLLSILPAFTAINNAFNLSRTTRLIRTVRLLKISRMSTEFTIFLEVLKEKRRVLLSVLIIAVIYIIFTALIVFNLDPNFDSFFQALYWSTMTLTTVGYGDVYPRTDWACLLSMISSLVGVAVIALPSGIITASYMKALEKCHNVSEDDKRKE